MSARTRWCIVAAFAAAMAWMEAATVAYLGVVSQLDPVQSASLGQTEIIREVATMLMLLAVGWLAGRRWRSRLGYTMIAFGLWDILYYACLRAIIGWPRSVIDWDVLFLIPLPWWGPVIAPLLISVLLVAGGTLMSQYERSAWPPRWAWGLSLVGGALALYVFMAEPLGTLAAGGPARTAMPTWFNWPLFGVALGLMAVPIGESAVVSLSRTRSQNRRANRSAMSRPIGSAAVAAGDGAFTTCTARADSAKEKSSSSLPSLPTA
jgi:hypothetical protein